MQTAIKLQPINQTSAFLNQTGKGLDAETHPAIVSDNPETVSFFPKDMTISNPHRSFSEAVTFLETS